MAKSKDVIGKTGRIGVVFFNTLDLRAGGFEVFPLAKLFDLPSNVWYPSILIRENMLAEPFAAWAANVFYTLGAVQVLQWSDGVFFYAPTANWLQPQHFVQRLTPVKVQAIISRVIRNAESANADPSRDFIIESLGIFGSVLADVTSSGDADVVFTARWRSNNRPLPEASYHPFGVSEPTNRVSRALSRGSRRMEENLGAAAIELMADDLREIEDAASKIPVQGLVTLNTWKSLSDRHGKQDSRL